MRIASRLAESPGSPYSTGMWFEVMNDRASSAVFSAALTAGWVVTMVT
jgi:hypothetical protein